MSIRWKDFKKTRFPGISKHLDGTGFVVRVRKKAANGETVDITRKLDGATETQAQEYRLTIIKEIEAGQYGKMEMLEQVPTLGDYARSWLKRKKLENGCKTMIWIQFQVGIYIQKLL